MGQNFVEENNVNPNLCFTLPSWTISGCYSIYEFNGSYNKVPLRLQDNQEVVENPPESQPIENITDVAIEDSSKIQLYSYNNGAKII